MTDNVIDLPVITTLDLDPQRVLKWAAEADLEGVVVVGTTKDGQEYFASSISDGAEIVWHLERTKLKVLRLPDEIA